MPCLVDYCATHGQVLIGTWALRERSAEISAMAVACDARAIMGRRELLLVLTLVLSCTKLPQPASILRKT